MCIKKYREKELLLKGEAYSYDSYFRGLGLANTLAGYQSGVRNFDSSIGLGVCPFAPKAVGNVCTEDMIHMFHKMEVKTGTDLDRLIETTKWLETVMDRALPGMVAKAGTS